MQVMKVGLLCYLGIKVLTPLMINLPKLIRASSLITAYSSLIIIFGVYYLNTKTSYMKKIRKLTSMIVNFEDVGEGRAHAD